MTVAELIAKLQQLPQDANVQIDCETDQVYEEVNQVFNSLDFGVKDVFVGDWPEEYDPEPVETVFIQIVRL